jgi:site-specific DNA-methyltransferase (adenine-specific)
MIQIFNQDCVEAMVNMPDGAHELAIVDPPYGLEASGNLSRRNGAGKLKNRAINLMSTAFDLIPPSPVYFEELMRVSKNQIIWGGNYFHLRPTRGIICWDKCQPWPNFSAWEMAWTSFDTPAKLFRYMKGQETAIHPTQKPVALYKWFLKNYAKPGDKILDTHLGSGSSAIAADIMGFDFTGHEIDTEYFEAAKERLERHQKQGNLFMPPELTTMTQESL